MPQRVAGLQLEGGDLLPQPVHVLGQGVGLRSGARGGRTTQRDDGEHDGEEGEDEGDRGEDPHGADPRRAAETSRSRHGGACQTPSRDDHPAEHRPDERPGPGARRIAYQGEPGANSHLVCQQAYPDWEPLPCASFEDAFAAVENGDADLAMIPIDNSIAGRVADIHHFLPTSNLHIVGERFLRIQFSLMATRAPTWPGCGPCTATCTRWASAAA